MVSIDRSRAHEGNCPDDPETSTMGDPAAEGRGLINGGLLATGFWVIVGVGFLIWMFTR